MESFLMSLAIFAAIVERIVELLKSTGVFDKLPDATRKNFVKLASVLVGIIVVGVNYDVIANVWPITEVGKIAGIVIAGIISGSGAAFINTALEIMLAIKRKQ